MNSHAERLDRLLCLYGEEYATPALSERTVAMKVQTMVAVRDQVAIHIELHGYGD